MFSTKAIIVKKAFADVKVDALSLLTLRMICSLPFFLLAGMFANSQTGNIQLTKRQWLQVIMLGLFGYYLSSFLDFEGLQYISAGLERLILFLYPTFVLLINSVYFKQKISAIQKTAVLLTYAGIAMAYAWELQLDIHKLNFLWGSFLVFLCAITYAIYIAGSGKIIPHTGATKFTAYAMLSSTVGVFIHFILRGNWVVLQSGNATIWWYGLLLAIVATVIPSFLISNGLKRIGANNVAIVSGIGPVSTIIQAHFVLGEQIRLPQIIGTMLVIAGVVMIGWKTSAKQKE